VNKRLIVREALVWCFLSFIFPGVAEYKEQLVLVDVFLRFMLAECSFFGGGAVSGRGVGFVMRGVSIGVCW
jgi:hypothetical protein